MTISVRKATQQDLPGIARICNTAFHPTTDTISRRLFPLHLKPQDAVDGEAAHLWRAARKSISMASERGIMMVAVDAASDGEIVGFSLWEIPETSLASVEAAPKFPEPPAELDQDAFAEVRSIANADITELFGERGTKDVWREFPRLLYSNVYLTEADLDYLGVDPKHQRRGIGKLLLNWGLDCAANQGRDCYLIATPAGRPLYTASGFGDVRTVLFFGIPHYSMVLRQAWK
ncbi:hypothetical protein FZEAL_9371 [Fusarium zealandicum]|uniref:N-acetyltransferase domain-containing protein n=1 Tax=Fusarium zealandicum TaxID=1053134 RepID=A0A8H4UC00_9HYPO|nr:hypothetical protein FZEAL_9371 [Fusarium zealandicum]